MKEFLSHQRTFSALSGLQEARTVCYILTEERVLGHICYGVQVTDVGAESGVHTDGARHFTDRRERAEALVQYLYENAVTAAQCASVLSDACSALNWTGWEDECGIAPDSATDCG